MTSDEIVKIALIGCWTLLGVGLVLYVWRRQSVAKETKKAEQSRVATENMEKIYNYLLQKPEGATMADITNLLLVDETQTAEYLGQLEASGIVRQFVGDDASNMFALNQNSQFNLS